MQMFLEWYCIFSYWFLKSWSLWTQCSTYSFWKRNVVKAYLLDLLDNDCSIISQIRGIFCHSASFMPAVWPLATTPCLRLCRASTRPAEHWVFLGCYTTYFGVTCPPAYARGISSHFRVHSLRSVLAYLGCGQSHVGQQPVSVSLCVCPFFSICMNGPWCGVLAVTAGLNKLSSDISNDNE